MRSVRPVHLRLAGEPGQTAWGRRSQRLPAEQHPALGTEHGAGHRISTMAGYTFARLPSPGRTVLFYLVVLGLLVPFFTYMIRCTSSSGPWVCWTPWSGPTWC